MTRETLQQKIEEALERYSNPIEAPYSAKEFAPVFLSLFIEFGEELIDVDEPTEVNIRMGVGGYRNDAMGRNELRQELCQKLAELKGEK